MEKIHVDISEDQGKREAYITNIVLSLVFLIPAGIAIVKMLWK